MKIYTKTGDDGTTGLQGGIRISKSSLRITAYGAVDELNAFLGLALSGVTQYPDVTKTLTRIQNELFVLGADLSNPDLGNISSSDSNGNNNNNRIQEIQTKKLESEIDLYTNELEPLTNFILPGGSLDIVAHLHIARTVARRAETNVVELAEHEKINLGCTQYLNRLSDLLFVLARVINKRKGVLDTIWTNHTNDSTDDINNNNN